MDYNELYEYLRKEKYVENLQQLSRAFLDDVSVFLSDLRNQTDRDDDLFAESALKSKKQLENSISIFKELILRRKRKLLNLVFVAAETGIMKRDYENMLGFERDIFDKLVRAFEEGDVELNKLINGKREVIADSNKMVIFDQDVAQFVDMNGEIVGPFYSGQLANLKMEVSEILVSGGKARFVDE
jgi:DNA replication initiation complex subunit (GINS family)